MMSAAPRPFSSDEMERPVLVTSSFPYACGPLRLGQLVDALQADIYTRFLRLVGRRATFIGGADSHGTDVQQGAMEAGVEPEQLAGRYCDEHFRDFTSQLVEFDRFTSTDGEDNRELSVLVFNRLRDKGYIYEREVPLDYCPRCRRFLSERFDRGRCPGCGSLVKTGGLCAVCSGGETGSGRDDDCPLCGGPTVPRLSRHYFFRLSEFSGRLASWVHGGSLQPQVEQWVDARLREGLDDWCISRDGPYFGFPVPGELKKFFCVWLDAPLGYLSGTTGRDGRPPWDDATSDVVQFVRRDIVAFHTLFWPAMLMGADFSLPGRIRVQGYLNVDGRRVAGRYGPRIDVRSLAGKTDPECLRYALASRMGDGLEEIDISPGRVTGALGEELSGLIVGFLRRSFAVPAGGAVGAVPEGMLNRYAAVGRAYAAIDCRRALALVRELARDAEPGPAAGRDLAILLDPVLPRLAEEVRMLAGGVRPWSWDDLGQPFDWRCGGSAESLSGRLECREIGGLLRGSDEP